MRLLTTDIRYPHSYYRMLRIYKQLIKENVILTNDILMSILQILTITINTPANENALVIAYAITNKIILKYVFN